MAVNHLAHVTLPVADLAAAGRFYVDALGCELVRRLDRDAFVRLRPERAAEADAANSPLHLALRLQGGAELHLFLQRDHVARPPRPHPHVALAVTADALRAAKARLEALGTRTDGPRRLGPPGHASLYFLDPFGNLLELVATSYDGDVLTGPPDVAALAPA